MKSPDDANIFSEPIGARPRVPVRSGQSGTSSSLGSQRAQFASARGFAGGWGGLGDRGVGHPTCAGRASLEYVRFGGVIDVCGVVGRRGATVGAMSADLALNAKTPGEPFVYAAAVGSATHPDASHKVGGGPTGTVYAHHLYASGKVRDANRRGRSRFEARTGYKPDTVSANRIGRG